MELEQTKVQKVWPLAAGLVVLVAAVYINSLHGVFIFDDSDSIQDNYTIQSLWPVWRTFMPPNGGATVAGRPVVNFTLAINWAISRMDVVSYHVVNVLLHALAALALFGLMRRTLLLPRWKGRFDASAAKLAFAAAAIWALHPLQTESVTYIVQRAESIMGLFYLLTLYCALRALTDSQGRVCSPGAPGFAAHEMADPTWATEQRLPTLHSAASASVCREEACTPYGWVWTAAAIACCAAGMASKEVMVSVPVAVVLFDRFFLFGSFKEALRRRWKLYVGLAATWVILGIEVAYNFTRGGSAGFTGNISAWGFLQAQTVWVTRYLKLTVWPSPLVLDYGMGLITGFSRIWPYALFIVLLLGASIAAIRYRPWVGYLAILFWMILAPTSSFVPNINQTAAEHRMYLPLAPLVVLMVMAVALGWDKLLGRMKLNEDSRWLMERAVLPTVLAFVLIALGVRTVIRNEDYQSLERMWTQANRDYPDCARLLQDMGSVYLEQQRYEDALKQFQRAVEVAPDYAHGYIGRADSLFRIGQASKSESERQKLFAEAEKDYTKAIQLDPRIHTAYSNLGVMHSQWGKKQQALEDLNKAVAVNPRHTQSRISRAAVEIDLKNFKAAREDLDVVLASNPDNFMCLHMRAEVLRSQGELPRALDDANRAVRVAESMLAKLNERGRSLLAGICLTRAEIYADMGQFSKAAEDVATARQAGARPSAELARKLAASGVR